MRIALVMVALMSLGLLLAQNSAVGWFSAAQAKRGQTLALGQCAACHGARLEGRYGPPLSGQRFAANWRSRSGKSLQLYVAQNMPKGRAGKLSETQTLELIAFILQANGYRAGTQDLRLEDLEKLELFKP
jgi:S-disulfanyl-L-cysteine oxidoreductase SoxD